MYEQLVKPANPVIDYNTQFTGLTESTLKDVTTTLKDVQDHLLGLFSEDTILVGHSLEHDLMALKVKQLLTKPWWCHDMGAFSALLAFCEGNPAVVPRTKGH